MSTILDYIFHLLFSKNVKSFTCQDQLFLLQLRRLVIATFSQQKLQLPHPGPGRNAIKIIEIIVCILFGLNCCQFAEVETNLLKGNL